LQQKKSDLHVGIIGGGQLGKMMLTEMKKMNLQAAILDPDADCPAHSLADDHLIADFFDSEAIKRLAARTDIITYEFEHIDAGVLQELSGAGHTIYPRPWNLQVINNKLDQKKLLAEKDIPVPEFIAVSNRQDLKEASEQLGRPFMLKSCTGGYDGKGNYLVEEGENPEKAFAELEGGKRELMAEEYIPYTREISALICRRPRGTALLYPLAHNIHENSILKKTQVPAVLPENLRGRAGEIAYRVADIFSAVGLFCIELFVTEEEVLLNEVAPRPHNSGHFSLEACITSQFENHIRAILDLPLGSTGLISPAAMRNILGSPPAGPTRVEGLEEALSVPESKIHLYGKSRTYKDRKMGHITALAETVEEASVLVEEARAKINICGVEEDH